MRITRTTFSTRSGPAKVSLAYHARRYLTSQESVSHYYFPTGAPPLHALGLDNLSASFPPCALGIELSRCSVSCHLQYLISPPPSMIQILVIG